MAVIGLDDTDSRDRGMCTTYLAARIAARLGADDHRIERSLLVRLNPAVEAKTRGNGALAIHTDAPVTTSLAIASEEIAAAAETDDPRTNPGLVLAPDADVSPAVSTFSARAMTDRLAITEAHGTCETAGYSYRSWKNGRGLIGALAAVGSWSVLSEWTAERIAYREPGKWGSPRRVDADSLFAAADRNYPDTWDSVDRVTGEAVCVPHTPCPVLFGIRGDDPEAVSETVAAVDAEPIERTHSFLTNQGTDTHLREAPIDAAADGRAYRLSGIVASAPETRRGGHVFFELVDREAAPDTDADSESRDGTRTDPLPAPDPISDSGAPRLACVAFEPTKHFRDRVRALCVGDSITVCGEVSDRTLKLEKFAVRDLRRVESATPTCPGCERSMESAGREQGYRCRDCETDRNGKVLRDIDRDLEIGWYEVPPRARRHVAKPLARGGFDAPTHPER